MDISFYFKNLEPSDAIKDYCKDKLAKLKERFHHIEGVDVRFNLVRQNQACEITVHADSTVFHVMKTDKDMYASIDIATETLHTQVDKYHKRIDNRGASKIAADVLPSFMPTNRDEDIAIHVLEAPAKPMTDIEALLQLQSEKYKFHMYHHVDERRYSLAFARPDGNYSLIFPTKEIGQYQEKIVKLHNNEMQEISYSLYPLSILTISEAMEKLTENNLEYLAFVNEDTRRMNILFFSKNGDLYLKKPANS